MGCSLPVFPNEQTFSECVGMPQRCQEADLTASDTTRTRSESCPTERSMGEHPAETKSQTTICFSPYLYRARNLIERLFNKIKQGRCVATGYDKLAADYLAFIKLHQSEFGYALMSPRPSTTLAL